MKRDIEYCTVQEVLEYLTSGDKLFRGKYKIKKDSLRYKTFFKDENSLRCVSCGIAGNIFSVTEVYDRKTNDTTYHFNLYHENHKGERTLMTKDHIIPKSKGGKNHISNMQTMCEHCNIEKGNKLWKHQEQ